MLAQHITYITLSASNVYVQSIIHNELKKNKQLIDPPTPTVQSNPTFISGREQGGIEETLYHKWMGWSLVRSLRPWHSLECTHQPLAPSAGLAQHVHCLMNRSPGYCKPWKLLVMDSGPGSCLFCNSYTMKASSNTGGLIDCVYSGQKEPSTRTAPVFFFLREGSYAALPAPNILTSLPRAPCFLTGCASLLSYPLHSPGP